MGNDKYKVLFVCLGNICRSPSAEAVFKACVTRAGMEEQVEIDSAGIIGYHAGEGADPRMKRHASRRGYRLTSISRPVFTKSLAQAVILSYILAHSRPRSESIQSKRLIPMVMVRTSRFSCSIIWFVSLTSNRFIIASPFRSDASY